MLSENIKNQRKAKGLSQEELAVRLNVVRQTISKWEKGLSVPDAELLIRLAEALDTTVSQLLDRTTEPAEHSELDAIAAKLEVLNSQFAAQREQRRKAWRLCFLVLGILGIVLLGARLVSFCWTLWVMGQMNGSASVIGGSDGSTGIFITGKLFDSAGLILGVVFAVIAAVGLYQTKR